jgi:hypothetical protein
MAFAVGVILGLMSGILSASVLRKSRHGVRERGATNVAVPKYQRPQANSFKVPR